MFDLSFVKGIKILKHTKISRNSFWLSCAIILGGGTKASVKALRIQKKVIKLITGIEKI